MVLILLIGLVLAGAAVALTARAAVMNRLRTAEALDQIESYGFARRQGEAAAHGALRTVLDELAGLVGGLGTRLGWVREAELRRQLMAAGLYALPPRRLVGYRILCALFIPGLWMWAAAVGGFPTVLRVLGLACALLAGWIAPMTVIRERAQRRSADVDHELPELIDLLVVTVEAGLGFTGSLQVAASRITGPLGDELRITLQEQNLGLATNEALRNMLMRCDTPAMRSFVRSIVQGETLGVSIGQIMRDLAVDMRKRRRAVAEEKAHKAPVKILFPLVFLIFPAMFVILLGPAIFSIIAAFKGG